MRRGRPIVDLFSRLVAPMARWRGRAESASAPPAAPLPALPERPTDDSFQLAMEALVKDEEGRYGTRLHIVSLVEFREAVGDRWGRLAGKVMMIGEGVIQQHLGNGSVYTHPELDIFILVFRNCPEAEAKRRATAIANDLGTRLVGDQFTKADQPEVLALDVAVADAVAGDGSLNFAAISTAIDSHRAFLNKTKPAKKDAADGGAAPASLTANRGQGAIADPGWQAAEKKAKLEVDTNWRQMEEKKAVQQTGVPALTPETRLSVVWRPTWLAATRSVAAYQAIVVRVDGKPETIRGGAAAYPGDPASCLSLDRAAVAEVVRTLTAPVAPADRFTAILSVHWKTVASAQRAAITQPLGELGAATRSSRLIVEIFGVPPDVSRRDLADSIGAMRGLTRQLALRVKPRDEALFDPAARSGIAMIGVDLGALGAAPSVEAVPAIMARLREWGGKVGLPVYAWGFRQRAHLLSAMEDRFAMVSGPALMADLRRPTKILAMPATSTPVVGA